MHLPTSALRRRSPSHTPGLAAATLMLATLVAVCSPAPAAALGDGALLYIAPSELSVGYDGLAFRLREAGATTVDQVGSWPAGSDLSASYRLVIVTPYDGPLDPAVGEDLAAFVAVGGGVVVTAEHYFGDEAGNALAARLGVSARFIAMDTGGGCSSTDVSGPTHALTTEAPTIEFAWARFVEGGTILYGAAAPIVTVEGTVLLAGDSDIFSDPVAFGGCGVGPSTERFYANLWTSLADEGGGPAADAGMADAGSAGDASVSGGLGATCSTNADCTSGLCANDGSRRYCTEVCTGSGSCPSGFTCSSAGSVNVCAPPASGGCRASAGSSASFRGLAPFALVALALSRRRARAHRPRS